MDDNIDVSRLERQRPDQTMVASQTLCLSSDLCLSDRPERGSLPLYSPCLPQPAEKEEVDPERERGFALPVAWYRREKGEKREAIVLAWEPFWLVNKVSNPTSR